MTIIKAGPESNKMKIFLINQYAGNKGDRAVLFALCLLLREVDPNAQITVSTSAPELWRDDTFISENNIRLVPWAWDYRRIESNRGYWRLLLRVHRYTFTLLREALLLKLHGFSRWIANPVFFRELRQADCVISVGGHHFTTLLSRDLVSAINYDAMCVLDARKRFVLFSQSFGPFEFHNPRNKKITKQILNSSRALYSREDSSVEALVQFGVSPSLIHHTSETVIALNRLFPKRTPVQQRSRRVGIAIYCTQKRSPKDEKAYCETFAAFVRMVINQGFAVSFFPMELKNSGPDDRPMIQKIIKMAGSPEQCSWIDNDLSTEKHLAEVANCQVFIGHKTHSTIFALATGTPLIGICYHPKTRMFMTQFDVEKYAIDDTELTFDILAAKFTDLYSQAEETSVAVFRKAQRFSSKLDEDMVEIIKIVKQKQ